MKLGMPRDESFLKELEYHHGFSDTEPGEDDWDAPDVPAELHWVDVRHPTLGPVAHIEWRRIPDETPVIKYIETESPYQGHGVATELLHHVRENYEPELEHDWDHLSPDSGEPWAKHVGHEVEEEERRFEEVPLWMIDYHRTKEMDRKVPEINELENWKIYPFHHPTQKPRGKGPSLSKRLGAEGEQPPAVQEKKKYPNKRNRHTWTAMDPCPECGAKKYTQYWGKGENPGSTQDFEIKRCLSCGYSRKYPWKRERPNNPRVKASSKPRLPKKEGNAFDDEKKRREEAAANADRNWWRQNVWWKSPEFQDWDTISRHLNGYHAWKDLQAVNWGMGELVAQKTDPKTIRDFALLAHTKMHQRKLAPEYTHPHTHEGYDDVEHMRNVTDIDWKSQRGPMKEGSQEGDGWWMLWRHGRDHSRDFNNEMNRFWRKGGSFAYARQLHLKEHQSGRDNHIAVAGHDIPWFAVYPHTHGGYDTADRLGDIHYLKGPGPVKEGSWEDLTPEQRADLAWRRDNVWLKSKEKKQFSAIREHLYDFHSRAEGTRAVDAANEMFRQGATPETILNFALLRHQKAHENLSITEMPYKHTHMGYHEFVLWSQINTLPRNSGPVKEGSKFYEDHRIPDHSYSRAELGYEGCISCRSRVHALESHALHHLNIREIPLEDVLREHALDHQRGPRWTGYPHHYGIHTHTNYEDLREPLWQMQGPMKIEGAAEREHYYSSQSHCEACRLRHHISRDHFNWNAGENWESLPIQEVIQSHKKEHEDSVENRARPDYQFMRYMLHRHLSLDDLKGLDRIQYASPGPMKEGGRPPLNDKYQASEHPLHSYRPWAWYPKEQLYRDHCRACTLRAHFDHYHVPLESVDSGIDGLEDPFDLVVEEHKRQHEAGPIQNPQWDENTGEWKYKGVHTHGGYDDLDELADCRAYLPPGEMKTEAGLIDDAFKMVEDPLSVPHGYRSIGHCEACDLRNHLDLSHMDHMDYGGRWPELKGLKTSELINYAATAPIEEIAAAHKAAHERGPVFLPPQQWANGSRRGYLHRHKGYGLRELLPAIYEYPGEIREGSQRTERGEILKHGVEGHGMNFDVYVDAVPDLLGLHEGIHMTTNPSYWYHTHQGYKDMEHFRKITPFTLKRGPLKEASIPEDHEYNECEDPECDTCDFRDHVTLRHRRIEQMNAYHQSLPYLMDEHYEDHKKGLVLNSPHMIPGFHTHRGYDNIDSLNEVNDAWAKGPKKMGAPRSRFRKEYEAVKREAVNQGWRINERAAHDQLIPPDKTKQLVTWHHTTSDHRAFSNFLSEMRRQGLEWPPPKRGVKSTDWVKGQRDWWKETELEENPYDYDDPNSWTNPLDDPHHRYWADYGKENRAPEKERQIRAHLSVHHRSDYHYNKAYSQLVDAHRHQHEMLWMVRGEGMRPRSIPHGHSSYVDHDAIVNPIFAQSGEMKEGAAGVDHPWACRSFKECPSCRFRDHAQWSHLNQSGQVNAATAPIADVIAEHKERHKNGIATLPPAFLPFSQEEVLPARTHIHRGLGELEDLLHVREAELPPRKEGSNSEIEDSHRAGGHQLKPDPNCALCHGKLASNSEIEDSHKAGGHRLKPDPNCALCHGKYADSLDAYFLKFDPGRHNLIGHIDFHHGGTECTYCDHPRDIHGPYGCEVDNCTLGCLHFRNNFIPNGPNEEGPFQSYEDIVDWHKKAHSSGWPFERPNGEEMSAPHTHADYSHPEAAIHLLKKPGPMKFEGGYRDPESGPNYWDKDVTISWPESDSDFGWHLELHHFPHCQNADCGHHTGDHFGDMGCSECDCDQMYYPGIDPQMPGLRENWLGLHKQWHEKGPLNLGPGTDAVPHTHANYEKPEDLIHLIHPGTRKEAREYPHHEYTTLEYPKSDAELQDHLIYHHEPYCRNCFHHDCKHWKNGCSKCGCPEFVGPEAEDREDLIFMHNEFHANGPETANMPHTHLNYEEPETFIRFIPLPGEVKEASGAI